MSDVIASQRAIVAEHIRGENDHDWNAVYNTFVQDERAHYQVVPMGATFPGIEGVRAFYQSIAAAVPDMKIEVTAEYDVPGCSIREVILSGTHQGEFAGVPASGNKVRIAIAGFYTFDSSSGKLLCERIYYDQASVMAQMMGQHSAAVA